MKKIVLIALVVMLVVIVLITARKTKTVIPFADIFPEGAIGYVGVRGGGALVHEVLRSNCWRKLGGIESVKRFTRAAGEKTRLDAGKGPLRSIAALLGEEAGAALYGYDNPIGSGILLGFKMSDKSQELQIRTLLGGAAAGEYAGIDLFSFFIPGRTDLKGVCAWKDGTLIAALSESRSLELLKAALDHYAGTGKTPLSRDKRFSKAMGPPVRERGTLIACACIDWQTVEKQLPRLSAVKEWEKLLERRNPQAFESLKRAWLTQPGCLSMSARIYRYRGLLARVSSRFDPERLTDEQRDIYIGQSERMRALDLAPRDTVLLNSYYMGNPRALLKWYREQEATSTGPLLLTRLEKVCGIDIERDLLPWLGREVSVQLSDVATGGLLPIPKVELLLEASDRRAAEGTVERIMKKLSTPSPQTPPEQQPWTFLMPQLQREQYKGQTVRTLTYPLPAFSPSVAIVGGFVVIGSDRDSVLGVIDVAKRSDKSLLTNSTFAEMRRGIPKRLMQMTYLDCAKALDLSEGVLNWFFAVRKLALIGKDETEVGREEKFQADLPAILSALKIFRAAMFAQSSDRNRIDHFFVLRMEDIK